MKTRLALSLLFLPLAGCALIPHAQVPTHYYLIAPPPQASPVPAPADLELAVEPLDSAARYTTRILSRTGDVAVAYYEFERWAEPPAEMLTSALRHALQAARVARVVVAGRLIQRPGALLRGRLNQFDEVHAPDGWSAGCAVELLLSWDDAERTVQSFHFAETRKARAKTTAAVAEAMSAAVAEVAAKATQAIAKALWGHEAKGTK